MCVVVVYLFPVENLSILALTADGFAVGGRTVVMGRNKEAGGPHSPARDCSVYQPVSSAERQVQGLPDVGR